MWLRWMDQKPNFAPLTSCVGAVEYALGTCLYQYSLREMELEPSKVYLGSTVPVCIMSWCGFAVFTRRSLAKQTSQNAQKLQEFSLLPNQMIKCEFADLILDM